MGIHYFNVVTFAFIFSKTKFCPIHTKVFFVTIVLKFEKNNNNYYIHKKKLP